MLDTNKKLVSFWETAAGSLVPEALATAHIKALASSTKEATPIVRCELYYGLLKERPGNPVGIDKNVQALLEELEANGREIQILHAADSRISESHLKEYLPEHAARWPLLNKLNCNLEFSARARGEMPQVEMVITPYRMPLPAHVSKIDPYDLKR